MTYDIRFLATAPVSDLKDLQIADSIILNKIQEKFHLAEETAKTYL